MPRKKSTNKKLKKSASKRNRRISRETLEEKAILNGLERISTNARRKAYRNNASVTIIRNGKIVKMYPGGREKIIGKITKEPIRKGISTSIRIR